MSIVDELLTAIRAWDDSRARSQQTEIGPSQIGGCRRQAWHAIQGTEPTNPNTRRLAAFMGTAIHDAIERAMAANDPWCRYELETELAGEWDGIALVGHADLIVASDREVIDWKTITQKKAAYFPSQEQVWQVQVYGWLLAQAGRPVDTVTLVGICRDGSEDDVVRHSEPYDEAVALEALAWLSEVRAMPDAPAPERDATVFCAKYCDYFGACPGRTSDTPEASLSDADATKVAAYLAAKERADEAAAAVEALRQALVGVSGVTDDGWKVAWSQRTSSTVDRDAIKAALGQVPMRTGRTSDVMTVKRVAS